MKKSLYLCRREVCLSFFRIHIVGSWDNRHFSACPAHYAVSAAFGHVVLQKFAAHVCLADGAQASGALYPQFS